MMVMDRLLGSWKGKEVGFTEGCLESKAGVGNGVKDLQLERKMDGIREEVSAVEEMVLGIQSRIQDRRGNGRRKSAK